MVVVVDSRCCDYWCMRSRSRVVERNVGSVVLILELIGEGAFVPPNGVWMMCLVKAEGCRVDGDVCGPWMVVQGGRLVRTVALGCEGAGRDPDSKWRNVGGDMSWRLMAPGCEGRCGEGGVVV
eukprot:3461831-Amphidinium_carterae.1